MCVGDKVEWWGKTLSLVIIFATAFVHVFHSAPDLGWLLGQKNLIIQHTYAFGDLTYNMIGCYCGA